MKKVPLNALRISSEYGSDQSFFNIFGVELDFGHLRMERLSIRQVPAGAAQKLGELWWRRRHHEIP